MCIVNNEHNIHCALIVRRRKRQRHFGLVVLVQIGCRLGFGAFPADHRRLRVRVRLDRLLPVRSLEGLQSRDRCRAIFELCKLFCMIGRSMRFPARAFAVVVPAVDGVVAVVELPIGTDFAEGDFGRRIVENVVACCIRMVVVNYSIARKRQIGRRTGVINAAAIAGSSLVVHIACDGQLGAFLKCNLAIVGQAAAIVVCDGNFCTTFDFASRYARGNLEASIIALCRVMCYAYLRGLIDCKLTLCINTIISIIVSN